MSLDTFATVRQRFNYLVGDTSAATSAIFDSHINASVADICNAYPFSWNIAKTTGTLSGAGLVTTFNLASDYNPKWHLLDARIAGTTIGGDHVFEEIVIPDQNAWPSGSYKHWITYDTSTHVYVFNSTEPSGTVVTYAYNFKPVVMAAAGDFCIIPDTEAVCYLAAAKNWLTDERNQALMAVYDQKASTRIQSMWQTDNAFGPVPTEGSPVDYNPYLLRR